MPIHFGFLDKTGNVIAWNIIYAAAIAYDDEHSEKKSPHSLITQCMDWMAIENSGKTVEQLIAKYEADPKMPRDLLEHYKASLTYISNKTGLYSFFANTYQYFGK